MIDTNIEDKGIMFNSVDNRPDMGQIMMFWVAKRAIL